VLERDLVRRRGIDPDRIHVDAHGPDVADIESQRFHVVVQEEQAHRGQDAHDQEREEHFDGNQEVGPPAVPRDPE
jgi:hypothetical protein